MELYLAIHNALNFYEQELSRDVVITLIMILSKKKTNSPLLTPMIVDKMNDNNLKKIIID